MFEDIFKYKKANFDKLLEYGFVEKNEKYFYQTNILNDMFNMQIEISKQEKVNAHLYDNNTKEEYVLHLINSSVGEFVGKVRNEFLNVLTDISNSCFFMQVFKSKQSKQILEFVKNKHGDELEFLWKNSPDVAILRRKDSKKWYAVMFVLSKKKLDGKSDEFVEIIDLRAQNNINLINNKNIFCGYHMNKKNWITICLDNTISSDLVLKYIEDSYDLAKK